LVSVRHPAALCRLIDLQRANFRSDDVPLDTVFEYEHPDPHDYFVNPLRACGRHGVIEMATRRYR
jgi:hypothetical protein